MNIEGIFEVELFCDYMYVKMCGVCGEVEDLSGEFVEMGVVVIDSV